jgi:DNA polymerase III sliding clamp (beta) subunit (PCNA family)
LQAKISDVKLLRILFQTIAYFIEVAYFDIKRDEFRIRGIDPHDFCYVDVKLYPNFFEEYNVDNEVSFVVEFQTLARVLSTTTTDKIFIKTVEQQIVISMNEKWEISFATEWLRTGTFNLPNPKNFNYEAIAKIPAKEFMRIIQRASTISHEISLLAEAPDKFKILANKNKSFFMAYPNYSNFEASIKGRAEVSVIIDYLKKLRKLINGCKYAEVSFGNEKPLRIDIDYKNKGFFSFLLSYKREEKPIKKQHYRKRGSTSLPRISMKTFEKFMIQVSKYPEGIDPQILKMAKLETKAGDCWRLADILALTYKDKGKIKLTPLGEAFIALYEKDIQKAKQFLHKLAKNNILPYRLMMDEIETPITINELHKKINIVLDKEAKYKINGQDVTTLLEIAKWCGIVLRKQGFLTFKE